MWSKQRLRLVQTSISVAVLILAVFGLLLLRTPHQVSAAGDCNANAVITCGVNSLDELKQKYMANQGNIQAIYREFGITSINDFDGMVTGSVGGDGNVFADNTLVATNAMSAGRQNIAGSVPIAGGLAFKRPTRVSFVNPNGSLTAFIKMNGNQFMFAIILSCGNPVSAQSAALPAPPPVPDFTIEKDVRMAGETVRHQAVSVQPGQAVEFHIIITNIGQTSLVNVTLNDHLPTGLQLVADSTKLDDQPMNSSFINGLFSLGTMVVGQQHIITFSATADLMLQGCPNNLMNTATVQPQNAPRKQASAAVIVCKAVPPSPPAPPTQPAAVTTPLPNTGAGDIIGVFMVTSSIAGLAHFSWRRWLHYIRD